MVVGRQCLHIKYGMFGRHMNECMSGPSLVSAYRMCEHLNVFSSLSLSLPLLLSLSSCCSSSSSLDSVCLRFYNKFIEVRKKRGRGGAEEERNAFILWLSECSSQIRSWCEAGMPQHMHIHIHTDTHFVPRSGLLWMLKPTFRDQEMCK